jgi:cysteine desulfurase
MWNWKKKRIFLDHASTTPLDRDVEHVMQKTARDHFANPSAWYREGVGAAASLTTLRQEVARVTHVTPSQVIFTRGGTESLHLALRGIIEQALRQGQYMPHVILSPFEHSAVEEIIEWYYVRGLIQRDYIPLEATGERIDVRALKALLKPETILVTCMYVNNELGTIQPLKEITKTVRWFKKHHGTSDSPYPLVHTDAMQAPLWCDLNLQALGVDALSFSGSKIYGPKSSGALIVRNRTFLAPWLVGGGQEFGLRAGTEDIAQSTGLVHALGKALQVQSKETRRMQDMIDWLRNFIHTALPEALITTPLSRTGDAVPHMLHLIIPDCESEQLVLRLDHYGFMVSAQSSCQKNIDGASRTVKAYCAARGLVLPTTYATVRISCGRGTTQADLKACGHTLAREVRAMRHEADMWLGKNIDSKE